MKTCSTDCTLFGTHIFPCTMLETPPFLFEIFFFNLRLQPFNTSLAKNTTDGRNGDFQITVVYTYKYMQNVFLYICCKNLRIRMEHIYKNAFNKATIEDKCFCLEKKYQFRIKRQLFNEHKHMSGTFFCQR